MYVLCSQHPPTLPCEVRGDCARTEEGAFVLERCTFANIREPLMFEGVAEAMCAPFNVPLSIRAFKVFKGRYIADQTTWAVIDPSDRKFSDEQGHNTLDSCVLGVDGRGALCFRGGNLVVRNPSRPGTIDAPGGCCLKFIYIESFKKTGVVVFYLCAKNHRSDEPNRCARCEEGDPTQPAAMRTARLGVYTLVDSEHNTLDIELWRPPRIEEPLLLSRSGWGFTPLR